MQSIRRTLTRNLLAALLVLSAVAGVGLYLHLRGEIIEQYDLALQAKARSLVSLVSVEGQNVVVEINERIMPEFRVGAREPEFVQVARAEGSIVFRSPSLGNQSLSTTRATGHERVFDTTLPDGVAGRSISVRCDASSATLVLTLGVSATEMNETLRDMLLSIVVTGAALCAATFATVMHVVKRGLRPLQSVGDTAARIDATSLSYRFQSEGMPAELRPICDRLNDLLARIEDAFTRERRFTANVAHELRTPVAELRTIAEVALKWPEDSTRSASNADVLAIAVQMERIITTLLEQVRCERQDVQRVVELVPLADVVSEAWSSCAALAADRKLSFENEVDESIIVKSDRTILLAILRNLFENSATYSPNEDTVHCRAVVSRDAVRVDVINAAPGLTPDDLSRLGEPFWRKDFARTDGAHAGLGLSLVCAYANVIGGKVRFSLDDDGEFCASLSLPAAPPQNESERIAPRQAEVVQSCPP